MAHKIGGNADLSAHFQQRFLHLQRKILDKSCSELARNESEIKTHMNQSVLDLENEKFRGLTRFFNEKPWEADVELFYRPVAEQTDKVQRQKSHVSHLKHRQL